MSAALLAATNKTLKAVSEDTDLFYADGYEQIASFVKSFGGTVPPKKASAASSASAEAEKKKADGDMSDDDRDDEENFWSVTEGQTAANATEGGFVDPREEAKKNPSSNPDADEEKAMGIKAEAAELFSEGNVDAAIAKMTEALTLCPAKAMYWALRADYYLKKKQALAAIHDAEVALGLNSENARALRVRGEVYRHMHKWEESAHDLNAAQRVDFSDKVEGLLKFVQPRANSRRDRRRKAELEAEERRKKDLLAKQEALRAQRKREEEEEAAEAAAAAAAGPTGRGGMGGGFPGMGGMGGMGGGGMPGGVPPGMEGLLSDPELMEAMQDPETAAKLQTLMSNPMAAMSLMGDPKVGPLIQKMMMKMGGGMGGGMPGMGGMGGGMPGGFPGMGGMGGMGGASGAAKNNHAEDLD